MAVVGSDQASVLDKVGGVWLERGTLDPGTLDSADDFGSSVSVSGDVVVVGAAGAEAAYVFRYGGIVWQMEQKLSAPDGPDGDAFGTSVGVDRGLIVVGAPEADPLGDQSGAAYVFERSGGPWVAVAKLSEGDEDDHFGTAARRWPSTATSWCSALPGSTTAARRRARRTSSSDEPRSDRATGDIFIKIAY